jgi:hypothetical protein
MQEHRMSNSLTWQELPEELLMQVLDGHLSLWEAAWLLDEWLMTPEGESRDLPKELWPACDKLTLLALEPAPTVH